MLQYELEVPEAAEVASAGTKQQLFVVFLCSTPHSACQLKCSHSIDFCFAFRSVLNLNARGQFATH